MKKILLSLLALSAIASASAEGFQVNNLSARQSGMGHTGTAMKLGSESIYFNPAATVFQDSAFDMSLGMTGILSYCTFTQQPTVENEGYNPDKPRQKWYSDNKMATPIFAYFNYKFKDRYAVGLGFYTPYGSAMNWGNDWIGNSLVQKIKMTAYTVQPTFSFKLHEKLSIGVGLTINFGSFELNRALATPQALQPILAQNPQLGTMIPQEMMQSFGANPYQALLGAKLKGKAGVSVGVNLGIMWNIHPDWTLAMSYRSKVVLKVNDGDAFVKYGNGVQQLLGGLKAVPGMETSSFGQLLDLLKQMEGAKIKAELPLPTTVTWGATFRPTERWELAFDLQWTGWSAYKRLDVELTPKDRNNDNKNKDNKLQIRSVKNYSNALAVRFGGEYKATNFLTVRSGLYIDQSPVSSDYLNPETPSMTKFCCTAGVSLHPAKCMSIDIAYGYVSSADPERTGSYPEYSLLDPNAKNPASVFSGNYKLYAHTISFGIGLHF